MGFLLQLLPSDHGRDGPCFSEGTLACFAGGRITCFRRGTGSGFRLGQCEDCDSVNELNKHPFRPYVPSSGPLEVN
jgi:hypothetical protein